LGDGAAFAEPRCAQALPLRYVRSNGVDVSSRRENSFARITLVAGRRNLQCAIISEMAANRHDDVLGSLPRSRPHRRSAKRAARPDAGPSARPDSTLAEQPGAAPGAEPPPVRELPGSNRSELLSTAVQAAAEVAEIGLSLTARAIRSILERLPRP
jgi:hypothetical protein